MLTCPRGHQWDAAKSRTCPACGSPSVTHATGVRPPAPPSAPTHPTAPTVAAVRPTVAGYEILGELGRGGMGVVYKARHVSLQRLVALKMVLTGEYASPQELARFRGEGLAVARLHHPNIVQIYEVGEQNGRPFFSLEFVDGGSLAQRLAGTTLPARSAAAMAETLARAVHHAHQQGIVHRDLKPGNILLKVVSGQSSVVSKDKAAPSSALTTDHLSLTTIPKITDFGLAKRTDGASDQTKTGSVLGTPSYIAPEQAAGRKEIGPSADIYALGAILYEMLTGRPPFRGESSMDTILQVMSEEPVAPRQLQPKLPRDLETICLKCLEKEPRKRYATADDLADDLRSFLDHKPIRGRPVGTRERMWRWSRRNPVVATLSALLLVALVGGFLSMTVLWRRAEANFQDAQHQRRNAEVNLAEAELQRTKAETNLREAQKQKARAEESFRQARQAVDDFFTTVSDSRLLNVPSLQPLRKELLDLALKYYQEFLKQHGNDPTIQKELARAYFRVGLINSQLGDGAKSLAAYQQSLEVYQQLLRADPDSVEYQHMAAAVGHNIAIHQIAHGRYADAERVLRDTVALREKLARSAPDNSLLQQSLAFSQEALAQHQASVGNIAEAFRLFEQSRLLRDKMAQAKPNTAVPLLQLARSLYSIGYLQYETGQLGDARRNLQQTRDICVRLTTPPIGSAEALQHLAQAASALGEVHLAAGQLPQALAAFEEARKLQAKLASENPTVAAYQRDLARTHYRVARALRAGGKNAEALAAAQQARTIQEALIKTDSLGFQSPMELAWTLTLMGALQRESGQAAEALRTLQQTRGTQEKLVQATSAFLDARSELADCLNELGLTLEALNRRDEALKAYQQAIQEQRIAFDKAPQVVQYRKHLSSQYVNQSRLLRDQGRLADAATTHRERQKLWPTNGSELYGITRELALTAAAVGKGKSSLTSAEQAEQLRYADWAIEALRSAIAQGFKDVEQVKTDPDLAVLRTRPDFSALVAKLEGKK
ncbi:MAG: protein kinase [Gemmataceae bacterium]|nr:protein kinase [Gemmataceae bacterium]